MSRLALDTSAAIPLLVQMHRDHAAVVAWWGGRELCLSGHAAVETYSVLTRLPGDLRVMPTDAAALLQERFVSTLPLSAALAAALPARLSALGISGGAVYDALVALAAQEHDAVLVTRDARAKATYELVGVAVEVVGPLGRRAG